MEYDFDYEFDFDCDVDYRGGVTENQGVMSKEGLKEKFLEVYKKTGAMVNKSCEAVGINRSTFFRWKEKDEEFAEKCKDIEEGLLDFVEASLLKQIQAGDTTATIFYLKTKGKNRGYVEKVQVDGKMDTDVRISYVQATSKFASREDEGED